MEHTIINTINSLLILITRLIRYLYLCINLRVNSS